MHATAMLFSISIVFAQSKLTYQKWQLQATAGSSVNYFTDEQPHRFNTTGYNAQVGINYNSNKHWSIFSEVGIAGTGGGLVSFQDDTYLGFDPTITFKNTKQSQYMIHAIDGKIGGGYTFNLKEGWKIKLYAAPSLSLNIGEWEKYEKTGYLALPKNASSPGIIGTISNRQYTDKFQPYWYSIVGGTQIEIPFHKQFFLVDFRFVNGVSPVIFDYSYLNTPGIQGNLRTNSFRVSLGYMISAFGKKHKK